MWIVYDPASARSRPTESTSAPLTEIAPRALAENLIGPPDLSAFSNPTIPLRGTILSS